MHFFRICVLDSSRSLKANIAYTEVDDVVVGSYYGYAGGGTFDQKYFFIGATLALVSDDMSDFPSAALSVADQISLDRFRAQYEQDFDTGEVSGSAQEFLADAKWTGDALIKVSEGASVDVLRRLQNSWNLLCWLD